MADKDGDEPSLELPSLGFGRKRRKKTRSEDIEAPAPHPAPQPPIEPATEPLTDSTLGAEDDARTEGVEPHPAPGPHPEPATRAMPTATTPAAATAPLFADEVETAHTRTEEPSAGGEHKEPRPRRQFRLPAVGGMTSALITGVLVGAVMVGLTGAGFRLCEVMQGTPSCGDPGFLLLLAIVIVSIIVGKALLAAWSSPDPGSTSFLAVGLLCVVALLFLVDVLFNWWTIIVIPVLGALCFALSHWVTTAFVDEE